MSIGQFRVYHAKSHEFGNRNFNFGIFSFLFVIIWVYQNFWVCYICLGFFTHIARGKQCVESGENAHRVIWFF